MPEPTSSKVNGSAAGEWRELDSRSAEGGLRTIALQWKAAQDGEDAQLRVQVVDLRPADPAVFHVAVRAGEDARRAFEHPYGYATDAELETAPLAGVR